MRLHSGSSFRSPLRSPKRAFMNFSAWNSCKGRMFRHERPRNCTMRRTSWQIIWKIICQEREMKFIRVFCSSESPMIWHCLGVATHCYQSWSAWMMLRALRMFKRFAMSCWSWSSSNIRASMGQLNGSRQYNWKGLPGLSRAPSKKFTSIHCQRYSA